MFVPWYELALQLPPSLYLLCSAYTSWEDLLFFAFPTGVRRARYFRRLVTKPMFEFEFEGELLPFIVNGDRFVLLALLPRRNPRTERDIAAAIFPFRGQPSLVAVTIASRGFRDGHGFFRFLGPGAVFFTLFLVRSCYAVRGGDPPLQVLVDEERATARRVRFRGCVGTSPTHVCDYEPTTSDVSTSTQVPKPMYEYETEGE